MKRKPNFYRKPIRSRMSMTQEKRRMHADDPRCHWCAVDLDEYNATVDHLIPLSVGGTDARSNLVLACVPCNNARGNSLGPPQNKASMPTKGRP
jgi:5-methylcytosine-specific restriction endonuclease McrA